MPGFAYVLQHLQPRYPAKDCTNIRPGVTCAIIAVDSGDFGRVASSLPAARASCHLAAIELQTLSPDKSCKSDKFVPVLTCT
jgi:hypothetical protein